MSATTEDYTRVVIVTGAAQGIGRAIALRLAADGLDVAVADIPSKIDSLNAVVKEIQGLGRKAVAVTTDVSKENEVKAMIETTVSALGRLDVMVANAGVTAGRSTVMDADVESWEKCWEVNIRGTLLCYKYAARQMVKQGAGGRIIGILILFFECRFNNLTISEVHPRSVVCEGSPVLVDIAYRRRLSELQAIHTYVYSARSALELREHKITANAYAPGAIDTEMIANPIDKEHGAGFAIKKLFKIQSDVRTGQPSDVANVVSFLASPDSHFVTGQTISVDDGIHFS
ncbi:hypothetical protein MVEN_02017300 [Mycena venus]|uniref:NAD(P)-binding protein n=1 Tax=Mycena venus TaxID=2733690 RepID=A0A8H6XCH3_9AGAR|nr:hypothetical protein MVEN_02017300 [Mycena venus]